MQEPAKEQARVMMAMVQEIARLLNWETDELRRARPHHEDGVGPGGGAAVG